MLYLIRIYKKKRQKHKSEHTTRFRILFYIVAMYESVVPSECCCVLIWNEISELREEVSIRHHPVSDSSDVRGNIGWKIKHKCYSYYSRTFCVFWSLWFNVDGSNDLPIWWRMLGMLSQHSLHYTQHIQRRYKQIESVTLSSVACGTLIYKNEICMLQFDQVVCLEPFANKRNKLNHFLISYKMNKK